MGLKIDIPIEIGDPVLRILCTQHDGYYLEAEMFSYSMIEEYLNGSIFCDYESAKNKLEELQKRGG